MLDYNLNHGGYARLRRRDEKGWRNGVPCRLRASLFVPQLRLCLYRCRHSVRDLLVVIITQLMGDKVRIAEHSLLALFDIPKILWPRLRLSWQWRRHHMITGRMDFCMDERGLKVKITTPIWLLVIPKVGSIFLPER